MSSPKQQIHWLLRDKYHNKLTPSAKKDIARLRQGEPLDYIIGWREFLGCKIDLSLRPLIPREETEFWINEAIKSICHSEQSERNERSEESRGSYDKDGFGPRSFGLRPQDDDMIQCLDLFSGSGCIGIAILKHVPQAKVDFTDIDKNCLKQIKINLKINKISKSRYRLFQTNVFDCHPEAELKARPKDLRKLPLSIGYSPRSFGVFSPHSKTPQDDPKKLKTVNFKSKTYDYIFANPPYINLRNKIKLQKSVLKYEPHQALFAKQNGLDFINQTLRQAKNYLKPNGQLFLEFSPEQKNVITILLKKYQYSNWRFNKDQFNRWRWLAVKID